MENQARLIIKTLDFILFRFVCVSVCLLCVRNLVSFSLFCKFRKSVEKLRKFKPVFSNFGFWNFVRIFFFFKQQTGWVIARAAGAGDAASEA